MIPVRTDYSDNFDECLKRARAVQRLTDASDRVRLAYKELDAANDELVAASQALDAMDGIEAQTTQMETKR